MKDDLVLALGNDLLGDDAVGLLVARVARARLNAEQVEVVESGEAGLALLELIADHRRVVIVDSIYTGEEPPGTVRVLTREDFRRVSAPSAHYAGLPEVLELGEKLHLAMPEELWVVAVEVENPFEFAPVPCTAVTDAIPLAVEKVVSFLSAG